MMPAPGPFAVGDDVASFAKTLPSSSTSTLIGRPLSEMLTHAAPSCKLNPRHDGSGVTSCVFRTQGPLPQQNITQIDQRHSDRTAAGIESLNLQCASDSRKCGHAVRPSAPACTTDQLVDRPAPA
eukprot:1983625-Rhodomonas_salina.2